jgi:hypothetical protein
VLLEGLQKDNYVQYFSYLEHAEELQMEVSDVLAMSRTSIYIYYSLTFGWQAQGFCKACGIICLQLVSVHIILCSSQMFIS